MRISVRGLDAPFVYPCSKADVREAFGEGILTSASFGLTPDHHYDRSKPIPRPSLRVILTFSVSTRRPDPYGDRIGLYIYRVPKADWSDYLHWQFREAMKTLRPWAQAVIDRPETARDWGWVAHIGLDQGRLIVEAPPLG